MNPNQLYQWLFVDIYIIILRCRNEYFQSFPLQDKSINDVNFFLSLSLLIDLREYTSLSIYLVFCMLIQSHSNFYLFFLNIVVFDLKQMTVFVFNYYSTKEKNVISLILSEEKTSEIVSVSRDSLFSIKFSESYSARYYCNMIFTPT